MNRKQIDALTRVLRARRQRCSEAERPVVDRVLMDVAEVLSEHNANFDAKRFIEETTR